MGRVHGRGRESPLKVPEVCRPWQCRVDTVSVCLWHELVVRAVLGVGVKAIVVAIPGVEILYGFCTLG